MPSPPCFLYGLFINHHIQNLILKYEDTLKHFWFSDVNGVGQCATNIGKQRAGRLLTTYKAESSLNNELLVPYVNSVELNTILGYPIKSLRYI